MKPISNEFIIRALQCDGYEDAGFVSSAASALILHLANPAYHLSSEILPRWISADPESTEPTAARKKTVNKRLPVIYFPPFVTFPRISFIG